jgi:pyruvate formate lyase activating enzyme
LIEYGLINYIAMDIKAPLDERYNKLAGVNVDMVALKKCIQLIMDSGLDYEFRTTVVPTLLTEEDILDMAKSLEGAKRYVLQQFVPKNARANALRDIKPYDAKTMNTLRDSAKAYVKGVFLRGLK